MAKVYTYPHWEINVIDKSIYNAVATEILPLFCPIFFCRTQKGPVGVPVWVEGYSNAVQKFGEGTFDENTKFFSREALYLKSLLTRQGAFITRMISEDSQYSSVVLELHVKKKKVPQYQRDAYGQYVINEATGERIPMADPSSGAELVEDGIELKWTTRPLKLDVTHNKETLRNLKPVTYGTGENEEVVYPIFAAKATDVGSYADDTGFKIFVDLDGIDDTLANNVGSLPYSFSAVKKSYGTDTAAAILSFFSNKSEAFCCKPNATDTRVARNVSFDDIMGNEYSGKLPYEIYIYSDNIEIIGKMIQAVEPDDETLFDPFMVNLTEPYNINGVPMPHVEMSEDEDAINLTDSRIIYLQGGRDGAIDDKTIEDLTCQYLRDKVYPELFDQPRYPFTHLIDTGVTLNTKKAMINFLGMHDACKIILSTQDCSMGRFNTKNEDMSLGSALYAAALMQPESTEKGTECCRCEIYQQAGYLANSNYRGIVPSTYDIMNKKSRWMYTQSITGQPAGLPNSIVDCFKEWSWTPCDADHKQRSWDSGLNYFQYYDMTGIHYPAMRTVYRYDTSVLSSALFTDVIVFCKHIARRNWATWAGVEVEFNTLAAKATERLNADLSRMLNGMFSASVQFSQSEEEAKIGYIAHVTIKLTGNPQQRVWKIDIECYRSGYTPEE